MPTAQCKCGYRASVSDALAGKTLKCPNCRDEMRVPAAAPGPAKPTKDRKNAAPVVEVSHGQMLVVGIILTLAVLVVIIILGPVRAWKQWGAMNPKASDAVGDVVTFALQAYLSERGEYNPYTVHHTPSVDGEITFSPPILAMSVPEEVYFMGKSNEGNFSGYYNTRTGEVRAEVQCGTSIGGAVVDMSRGGGTLHVTGRDINGQPQAEVDGKKVVIVYPPNDE